MLTWDAAGAAVIAPAVGLRSGGQDGRLGDARGPAGAARRVRRAAPAPAAGTTRPATLLDDRDREEVRVPRPAHPGRAAPAADARTYAPGTAG